MRHNCLRDAVWNAVWNALERKLFDIQVFHAPAPTNAAKTIPQMYHARK